MSEFIPFKKKEVESITLAEWIVSHSSEDELREVFLNMDRALKYIHEHGYCIEVFYPSEIEILDNDVNKIQFKKLMQLSLDSSRKRDMIKEDVFNSSLIQIGIYSNSLKYLRPEFLKEHFEEISQFIPSGDIPYYRGVVQRNAIVYFCEYALEKRNRDLAELEKQVDDGSSKGRQLLKSTSHNIGVESINNDKINDEIYSQINGMKEAAFVNLLMMPTMILVVLFLLGLIGWIFSLI